MNLFLVLKSNKQKKLQFFGIFSSFFATIFFSLSPIFGKTLLNHLTPFTLLALGTFFSALLVLFFFGCIEELKKLKQLPFHQILILAFIGLFSAVIAPLFFLWGLEMIPASDASLVSNSEPIFLAFFGVLFLKEKISRNQIIGTMAMILGILFIATAGFSVALEFSGGYMFIVISGVFYSISNTLFKKYLHHVSPEIVIFIRNIVGAIILFTLVPFLFGFSHDLDLLGNKQILFFLAGYVGFGIFLGQMLWYKALDTISVSLNSVISLAYPIFGVFFAWLFLNEHIHVYHFLGGSFIIGGLFFSMIHNKKHKQHHHLLQKLRHSFHL